MRKILFAFFLDVQALHDRMGTPRGARGCMAKRKQNELVPSSTAEYLTYVASVGGCRESMEVRYEDENIWLT